jgi:isoleucyl-tRNA synthetase
LTKQVILCVFTGLFLGKALKNKRNVENEAAWKEILKLRSEVSGLWFDCEEKEKSFKILEMDFIDSWTEVQRLKASNAEQNKCIASLEAELGQMRKEYEIEMMKLRQSSVEVAANLSSAQIKINDMKAKINHVRGLNENYRILLANCHTLGNRCHKERLKTFSAAGALSKERKIFRFRLRRFNEVGSQ